MAVREDAMMEWQKMSATWLYAAAQKGSLLSPTTHPHTPTTKVKSEQNSAGTQMRWADGDSPKKTCTKRQTPPW